MRVPAVADARSVTKRCGRHSYDRELLANSNLPEQGGKRTNYRAFPGTRAYFRLLSDCLWDNIAFPFAEKPLPGPSQMRRPGGSKTLRHRLLHSFTKHAPVRGHMSKPNLVLLCLLSFSMLGHAEQVTLKNGDRLTGAIVSMDGKKLVVHTSYAGDVSIDWSEVSQFSSDKPLVITRTDKQVLSGTVATEGQDVMITTAQGQQKLTLSDVSAMRSPADQAVYEKSLHPGMLEGWAGGGSFGFALARGNSQTTNL